LPGGGGAGAGRNPPRVPRLDDYFKAIVSSERNVVFTCLKHLNVASFHLVAIDLHRAERDHNPVTA
jgi:hypothetical protein